MIKADDLDKTGKEIDTGTPNQADLAKEDTAGNITATLMTLDGPKTDQISTRKPLDLSIPYTTAPVEICDEGKIALILSSIKYGNERGFKRLGGDIKTKIVDGKELEMIGEEFYFMGNDGSSVKISISTYDKAFNAIKIATITFMGNGILAKLKYEEIGYKTNLELTHGDITITELIKLIGKTLNSSTPQK